jgi:hypothetical protein
MPAEMRDSSTKAANQETDEPSARGPPSLMHGAGTGSGKAKSHEEEGDGGARAQGPLKATGSRRPLT